VTLTIAYTTSRQEPCIQWFFDSLHRETGGDYSGIKVIVVDFWKHIRSRGNVSINWVELLSHCLSTVYTPPKPSVWQGKHRLTSADYFDQCNARNTALCLAPDGWIAFVDDLTILMPGWLKSVREAIAGNYIACGAYRKAKDMVVKDGILQSFTDHIAGVDHRWAHGSDERAVDCTGSWAYGCSLAMPVEAALAVGGYPEALCAGIGYEDTIMGKMLENAGNKFKYDRRMLTYESEEGHAQLPVMKREDPCRGDPNANPRDDMSHAMLRAVKDMKFHPNYFGDEGIRGLRNRVLAGEPFPIMQIPQHRWFDSKPLSEL